MTHIFCCSFNRYFVQVREGGGSEPLEALGAITEDLQGMTIKYSAVRVRTYMLSCFLFDPSFLSFMP